jgi:hypothetical protein
VTYVNRPFLRVDLEAACEFWDADGYCTIRDCSVDEEEAKHEKELSAIDKSHDHDTIADNWPSAADSMWTNENPTCARAHITCLLGLDARPADID